LVETEKGEQHGSQIFPQLSEPVLFDGDGRCVDCLYAGHPATGLPDFTNSLPACSGASARGSGSSGRILHTDFLVARLLVTATTLADDLCNKASVTNWDLDVETSNFVEVSSTVLSTATP
jgi:hypothetical protein